MYQKMLTLERRSEPRGMCVALPLFSRKDRYSIGIGNLGRKPFVGLDPLCLIWLRC